MCLAEANERGGEMRGRKMLRLTSPFLLGFDVEVGELLEHRRIINPPQSKQHFKSTLLD